MRDTHVPTCRRMISESVLLRQFSYIITWTLVHEFDPIGKLKIVHRHNIPRDECDIPYATPYSVRSSL